MLVVCTVRRELEGQKYNVPYREMGSNITCSKKVITTIRGSHAKQTALFVGHIPHAGVWTNTKVTLSPPNQICYNIIASKRPMRPYKKHVFQYTNYASDLTYLYAN